MLYSHEKHNVTMAKVIDHWVNRSTTELMGKKTQQGEKKLGIKVGMRAIGTS